MAPIIIDGAELLESSTDGYVRRATLLSNDRNLLAVVSEGKHGLFRVALCRRIKDFHYQGGEGWGGDESSLTDTMEAAKRLALSLLEGPPPPGDSDPRVV